MQIQGAASTGNVGTGQTTASVQPGIRQAAATPVHSLLDVFIGKQTGGATTADALKFQNDLKEIMKQNGLNHEIFALPVPQQGAVLVKLTDMAQGVVLLMADAYGHLVGSNDKVLSEYLKEATHYVASNSQYGVSVIGMLVVMPTDYRNVAAIYQKITMWSSGFNPDGAEIHTVGLLKGTTLFVSTDVTQVRAMASRFISGLPPRIDIGLVIGIKKLKNMQYGIDPNNNTDAEPLGFIGGYVDFEYRHNMNTQTPGYRPIIHINTINPIIGSKSVSLLLLSAFYQIIVNSGVWWQQIRSNIHNQSGVIENIGNLIVDNKGVPLTCNTEEEAISFRNQFINPLPIVFIDCLEGHSAIPPFMTNMFQANPNDMQSFAVMLSDVFGTQENVTNAILPSIPGAECISKVSAIELPKGQGLFSSDFLTYLTVLHQFPGAVTPQQASLLQSNFMNDRTIVVREITSQRPQALYVKRSYALNPQFVQWVIWAFGMAGVTVVPPQLTGSRIMMPTDSIGQAYDRAMMAVTFGNQAMFVNGGGTVITPSFNFGTSV